jgi:hypothetical protein
MSALSKNSAARFSRSPIFRDSRRAGLQTSEYSKDDGLPAPSLVDSEENTNDNEFAAFKDPPLGDDDETETSPYRLRTQK